MAADMHGCDKRTALSGLNDALEDVVDLLVGIVPDQLHTN